MLRLLCLLVPAALCQPLKLCLFPRCGAAPAMRQGPPGAALKRRPLQQRRRRSSERRWPPSTACRWAAAWRTASVWCVCSDSLGAGWKCSRRLVAAKILMVPGHAGLCLLQGDRALDRILPRPYVAQWKDLEQQVGSRHG